MVNYREKIIALWTVFLLGTLFHVQLGLMPLFHGLTVAESQPAQNLGDIAGMMWLMLAFFVVPMFAIVAAAFTDAKGYRVIHFVVTLVYSVLNLLHLILDLFVQPLLWYQIALMVLLFIFGLLLNVVAYQWMRVEVRHHKRMFLHQVSHE
ncbi:MAG: hypothetical protein QNJ51_03470 [Calothrix sp. MO_167.B12]|nr:hypothetical protein [Calothrix sp. MO_167.B12]